MPVKHIADFYRQLERGFPGAFWTTHLTAFRRISEALLAGNGTRAERLCLRHMQSALDLMRQGFGRGASTEARRHEHDDMKFAR